MAVYTDIQHLPAFRNPVVTIGTFDGVHRGHRAILSKVVALAKELQGESVLITFEPHPRKLLYPQQPLGIITPLQQKLALLSEVGIENVVVFPFTKEFSLQPADHYIAHFLVRYFHPYHIIIGYDHRFGHDRAGDISLLKAYADTYGYAVDEIAAQLIDDAAVSSTKIRKALTRGAVEEAAGMLGRHYTLAGTVIEGKKLGRTIGYPTANLAPLDTDQLVPGNGIYAVQVKMAGGVYDGMLSIGFNPTVSDEQQLHIEVHIFDFDGDLYGQQLELVFIAYLRAEERYESLEALTRQLALDKEQALRILRPRA
jgi:riboflavin kinase / FMN adenylyltransferase